MNSVLELVPALRLGVNYLGGAFKSERHFLDFVIDGESLWEVLGKSLDAVSVICFEFSPEETVEAVNRLLLKGDSTIPRDRRSLFICSECGEFGCGAVTALVVREGPSIIWRDFGYENDYEEDVHLNKYKHVGPYTFDWVAYESALLRAVEKLR